MNMEIILTKHTILEPNVHGNIYDITYSNGIILIMIFIFIYFFIFSFPTKYNT